MKFIPWTIKTCQYITIKPKEVFSPLVRINKTIRPKFEKKLDVLKKNSEMRDVEMFTAFHYHSKLCSNLLLNAGEFP